MKQHDNFASAPQGGDNAYKDNFSLGSDQEQEERDGANNKSNSIRKTAKDIAIAVSGGAATGGLCGLAKYCIQYSGELSKMPDDVQKQIKKNIGFFALIGIAVVGGVYFIKSRRDSSKEKAKQAAKSEADCKLIHAQTESYLEKRRADLEFERGKSEIRQHEFEMKRKAMRDIKLQNEESTLPNSEVVENPDETFFNTNEEQDWLDSFHEQHQLPQEHPYILREVLRGCPKGFEEPMILHLLQALGAICFSRVRAQYVDGLHAPSLQVIIEGETGQGKAKFDDVYKCLFERIIQESAKKISDIDAMRDLPIEEQPHYIIQTAGTGISEARLINILAENDGVHFDMFETEISAVRRQLRKPGGLSYEHLRKAFSNESTYRNNCSKDGKNGMFQVFFNYSFTGTPQEVDKFISQEIESGNANRICWSAIPKNGRCPASLTLPPDKTVEAIRNKIDEWRSQFCFTTTDNGEDMVQQITEIDLSYVKAELQKWIVAQWDIAFAKKNSDQAQVRTRIAAIAFHCAIVLHMLYGNPSAHQPEVRNHVVQYTLYLADYCMARYLKRFRKKSSTTMSSPHSPSQVSELIPPTVDEQHEEEETIQELPISLVARIAKEYVHGKIGYGRLARKYGIFNSKGDPNRSKIERALDEWRRRQHHEK